MKSTRNLVYLILLGAIWGASFLFIRASVSTLGPFPLMFSRVFVAGVLLALYAAFSGKLKLSTFKSHWHQFLIVGLLNSALPFSLIGFSQLHITASLGSILNATTALFAAFFAVIFLGDRLTTLKGIGLLTGIGGVIVLVGWSPIPLTAPVILAIFGSLGAAISYALSGIYISKQFRDMPSMTLAIGQQIGSALLLLPLGAFNLPETFQPSPGVIAAVAALGLLCTAFAYILYFHLIEEEGPIKTLIVTYLVPAFGTLWGVLFLGESITLSVVIGFIAIIASVILVNQPALFQRLFHRPEAPAALEMKAD